MDAKNPTITSEEDFGPKSLSGAASSLAAVLKTIFSTQKGQLLGGDDKRALRMTCKQVKHAVDFHVKYFKTTAFGKRCGGCYRPLRDISRDMAAPWPWPNLTKLDMWHPNGVGNSILQNDFEYLVTLPLLKLESLHLKCISAMTLQQEYVQTNWPMLAELELHMLPVYSHEIKLQTIFTPRSLGIAYQKDLQFPELPLKNFKLTARRGNGYMGNTCDPDLAFVGQFLKSCPELIKFGIDVSPDYCTERLAAMITAAPLENLQSLHIERASSPRFYLNLFERDWPEMQSLYLPEMCSAIISLLSSKSWVKHVKNFEFQFPDDTAVTADELHTFLKYLENGEIESLILHNLLFFTVSKGFRSVTLNKLKTLDCHYVTAFELDEGIDVSTFINVFFTGSRFPVLESIRIDVDADGNVLKWLQPPGSGRQDIVDSLPSLKEISLASFDLFPVVAEYLGNFRRQGGRLKITDCHVRETSLPLEYEQILAKLGLDKEIWKEFCKGNVGEEFYQDSFYWHSISEIQFKRIAYAAVLKNCTNVPTLEKFLILCEAEEEGIVVTANTLKTLRDFLERIKFDHSRLGVDQQLKWQKLDSLIDFKMQLDPEFKG